MADYEQWGKKIEREEGSSRFRRRTYRADLDALLRRLLGGQAEAEHLIGQLLHHRGAENTWNGLVMKTMLWCGEKKYKGWASCNRWRPEMAEKTERDGDCVKISWLRVVNFKERETEKATEQRGISGEGEWSRENIRERTTSPIFQSRNSLTLWLSALHLSGRCQTPLCLGPLPGSEPSERFL